MNSPLLGAPGQPAFSRTKGPLPAGCTLWPKWGHWPPAQGGQGACLGGARPPHLPQPCGLSPLPPKSGPGAPFLLLPAGLCQAAVHPQHSCVGDRAGWSAEAGVALASLWRGVLPTTDLSESPGLQRGWNPRADQAAHIAGLHWGGCSAPLVPPSLLDRWPSQHSLCPQLLLSHCPVCSISLTCSMGWKHPAASPHLPSLPSSQARAPDWGPACPQLHS